MALGLVGQGLSTLLINQLLIAISSDLWEVVFDSLAEFVSLILSVIRKLLIENKIYAFNLSSIGLEASEASN